MHRLYTLLWSLLLLLVSAACAGIPLPGTEYRLLEWSVESEHKEVNSGCTNLAALTDFASALEEQHLLFLRTKDDANALVSSNILQHLSQECQGRIRTLSIPEIKNELFGDIQIINDVTKLTQLGGISFAYTDKSTMSQVEFSLHMKHHQTGPERRLVAIYRLEDDRVIHYNYSGTDNVDQKSRRWPIDEFLGLAIRGAARAIIP
jgi:hypothetical protein